MATSAAETSGTTSSGTHRKIELETNDDLRHLIQLARNAATQHLDRDLPRTEGEDEYRAKVEELVHAYINRTYTLVSQNLTISGLPPTPSLLSTRTSTSSPLSQLQPIEDLEPVDTKLSARARELLREEELLRIEIASLRRAAPAEAVEKYKSAWKESLEGDEKTSREAREALLESGEEVKVELDWEGGKGPEEMWRRGTEGLGRLEVDMTGTAARMERARGAGEYVLKEK